MTEKTNPADRKTDTNPAHQTDESKGAIKSRQVTDDTMRKKDLARGSEPETRGNSRQR